MQVLVYELGSQTSVCEYLAEKNHRFTSGYFNKALTLSFCLLIFKGGKITLGYHILQFPPSYLEGCQPMTQGLLYFLCTVGILSERWEVPSQPSELQHTSLCLIAIYAFVYIVQHAVEWKQFWPHVFSLPACSQLLWYSDIQRTWSMYVTELDVLRSSKTVRLFRVVYFLYRCQFIQGSGVAKLESPMDVFQIR